MAVTIISALGIFPYNDYIKLFVFAVTTVVCIRAVIEQMRGKNYHALIINCIALLLMVAGDAIHILNMLNK